tara:strand:- start:3659 stop:4912 length:1254 start_codon:yes stop_codon:yes gene_type:complete
MYVEIDKVYDSSTLEELDYNSILFDANTQKGRIIFSSITEEPISFLAEYISSNSSKALVGTTIKLKDFALQEKTFAPITDEFAQEPNFYKYLDSYNFSEGIFAKNIKINSYLNAEQLLINEYTNIEKALLSPQFITYYSVLPISKLYIPCEVIYSKNGTYRLFDTQLMYINNIKGLSFYEKGTHLANNNVDTSNFKKAGTKIQPKPNQYLNAKSLSATDSKLVEIGERYICLDKNGKDKSFIIPAFIINNFYHYYTKYITVSYWDSADFKGAVIYDGINLVGAYKCKLETLPQAFLQDISTSLALPFNSTNVLQKIGTTAPLFSGGNMIDALTLDEISNKVLEMYPELDTKGVVIPTPIAPTIDSEDLEEEIDDAEFQVEQLELALETVKDEEEIDSIEFQILILQSAIEELKNKLQ